jgi:hypothetical protein
MEQASMLELLQIIGALLKVFALVVLAVTLVITSGVVVSMLLQWWFSKNDAVGHRVA